MTYAYPAIINTPTNNSCINANSNKNSCSDNNELKETKINIKMGLEN